MSDAERRKIIALRLKEARRLSGLSQGQVGQMMNLHRPTISEIEAGNRRVNADELSKLAKIYDVSAGYLLGDTPEALEIDDPRLQLAARELKNLTPESLEKLLKALAALRSNDEDGSTS